MSKNAKKSKEEVKEKKGFTIEVTPMSNDEIDEHLKQIMSGNKEHTREDYLRDRLNKK